MRIHRLMFTAAAAGLLFAGCAEQGAEEETEPTVETTPQTGGQTGATTTADSGVTAQIMADPTTWSGRTVTGEVEVAEVVSPRAFYVTDQGQRLLVVLESQPTQELNLQQGQVVQIQSATVQGPAYLQQMTGDPIDEQARQAAEGQTAFLVVDGGAVQAAPQGTTATGLREGGVGAGTGR